MRIVYLFTSFPVASETFLQREIRAMRSRGDVEVELWSIWGGSKEWDGLPVNCYPFWSIVRVIFLQVARWAIRRPGALRRVWKAYMSESAPDLLNIGENMLGLAFGLDKAAEFMNRKERPDVFHAVWGTMPAAAAWLLHELTGIPFSMGAHAYDVFRHGGDWTLRQKLATARLIHTSTVATRSRLLQLGVAPEKVRLIRRGLEVLPEFLPATAQPPAATVPAAQPPAPLRLLSIGRLVPKKGYFQQLAVFRALRDADIAFTARIVGGGFLEPELRRECAKLGLAGIVTFTGEMPHEETLAEFARADVFVFTGVVAEDGDRDGLPNVIPEAFAHGVPVITTPVSGTTEAVHNGTTGQVVHINDRDGWVCAVRRLRDDALFRERSRCEARRWVETEFLAKDNAAKLAAELAGLCNVK